METVQQMEYGRIADGVRAYRNCHTAERQLPYGHDRWLWTQTKATYRFCLKNDCMSCLHSSPSTPEVTVALGCRALGA